jgi:hypothetical protein
MRLLLVALPMRPMGSAPRVVLARSMLRSLSTGLLVVAALVPVMVLVRRGGGALLDGVRCW